jgi:polysaccharide biosynthesis transport protein
MSRNFELLRQADWRQEFFSGVPTRSPQGETERKRVKRRPLGTDQISNLVQRLFLDPRSSHIRSILFTATERKVGCTWTCASAARVLAESVEGTVCAVDANLQAPSLHRYFPVPAANGLSETLGGSQAAATELARQINESNLWVASAGRYAGRAQMARGQAELETQLRELRRRFDYLLVDAPPIAMAPNVIAVGKALDGAVLVVESNAVGPKSVMRAREHLDRAHVRLLGVVLNRRDTVLPSVLDRLVR